MKTKTRPKKSAPKPRKSFDAKLAALRTMTPAQVQTWVQNNVNTLADAKDALKTMAVALCILARRI